MKILLVFFIAGITFFHSPAFASEHPDESKLKSGVLIAFHLHERNPEFEAEDEASLWLYSFMLLNDPPAIEQQRNVVNSGFPKSFGYRFEKAQQWFKELEAAGAEKAFELHKKYETPQQPKVRKLLATELLLYAVRKKHHPATLKRVEQLFSTSRKKSHRLGCDYLRDMAKEGNEEALWRLVTRYEQGDGVERSPGKAYVWLWILLSQKIKETTTRTGTAGLDLHSTFGAVDARQLMSEFAKRYGEFADLVSTKLSMHMEKNLKALNDDEFKLASKLLERKDYPRCES